MKYLNENNWILDNLQYVIEFWNNTLGEIWPLITMHPSEFRQGALWQTMLDVNGALQSIGFALLVLFFLVGVVRRAAVSRKLKSPNKL